MHRKVISVIAISMLLLVVQSLTSRVPIKAEELPKFPVKYPFVYVYPEVVTANVGETFTISVVVFNLTDAKVSDPENPLTTVSLGNLYGFDIKFSWDPTVIQYVNCTNPNSQVGGYKHPNVTAPVESYSAPILPSAFAGILHGFGSQNQSLLEIKNVVNETVNLYHFYPSVRAWFAYATIYPAMPFNGNGTIFIITFRVLKKGTSPLEIVNCELADKDGNWIGRTVSGQWLNPPRSGTFRTIEAPVASFTYRPSVGVANKSMHFTASVTENTTTIQKYMWDFSDETKINTTISTVEHNYTVGGLYAVSLRVVDMNGVESATITQEVKIANRRDLMVESIILPHHYLLPNREFTVKAVIYNLGSPWYMFSENCTATLSFNATCVCQIPPADTTWISVGINQTEIKAGSVKLISFKLNSSDLPMKEAYYHFLLNVTGIPNGYEANSTNNVYISEFVFYTEQVIHQPIITQLESGYWYLDRFRLLVIEGENVTIRVKVKNDGNENDRFNVTVYANSTVVKSWQTSELEPGATQTLVAEQQLSFGYYLLVVEAKVDNVSDMAQCFLRVIKPPKLTVRYNPEQPIISREVVFNASESIHQDPKGCITLYMWHIYAPGVDPRWAPPTAILVRWNITWMSYTFNKTGRWTIVLEIEDSYGIRYTPRRPATEKYRIEMIIEVRTTVGDVNGDGKVGIEDIILASSQYGLRPGDPNYNNVIVAYADLAAPHNGVIDILDIVTIASNYGKKA